MSLQKIFSIPPPVDEVTDEEELDDGISENEKNFPDFARTYEIHTVLPDTIEDLNNHPLPIKFKKSKS